MAFGAHDAVAGRTWSWSPKTKAMPSGLGPTWWLCGVRRRLRGIPQCPLPPPTGSSPAAQGPVPRWNRTPRGSRRGPASLGPRPRAPPAPRNLFRESRNSVPRLADRCPETWFPGYVLLACSSPRPWWVRFAGLFAAHTGVGTFYWLDRRPLGGGSLSLSVRPAEAKVGTFYWSVRRPAEQCPLGTFSWFVRRPESWVRFTGLFCLPDKRPGTVFRRSRNTVPHGGEFWPPSTGALPPGHTDPERDPEPPEHSRT